MRIQAAPEIKRLARFAGIFAYIAGTVSTVLSSGARIFAFFHGPLTILAAEFASEQWPNHSSRIQFQAKATTRPFAVVPPQ